MPVAARVSLALLAVGIGLVVSSVFWKQDLGFNRGFSDADAREYAEASSLLHDAMHESAHSHSEQTEQDIPDVAAAQARFDAAQARREHAIDSRAFAAGLMKWGGLAITIASAATLWVNRE